MRLKILCFVAILFLAGFAEVQKRTLLLENISIVEVDTDRASQSREEVVVVMVEDGIKFEPLSDKVLQNILIQEAKEVPIPVLPPEEEEIFVKLVEAVEVKAEIIEVAVPQEVIIQEEIILDEAILEEPAEILETMHASAPVQKKRLETPEKVKGIYLTAYSFLNKNQREYLLDLVRTTELNTVVIDLKDQNGAFIFPPKSDILKELPQARSSFDFETFHGLLEELEAEGIYTIARVLTFQDPSAANGIPSLALKNKRGKIWKNWLGISWLDPTNRSAWEIPVLQAQEAVELGFDEIQFDYIRFPSDGNLRTIEYANYPDGTKKYEVMHDFFEYLATELEPLGTKISADLFGMTYWLVSNREEDLNIGQRVVDAAKYFDYLSPMIYPSHYPKNFLGYKNPAEHPYAVVKKGLDDGNVLMKRIENPKAKTRPWIQDFDLGSIYDKEKVRAQIRACDQTGAAGWILWSARNVYTKSALKAL